MASALLSSRMCAAQQLAAPCANSARVPSAAAAATSRSHSPLLPLAHAAFLGIGLNAETRSRTGGPTVNQCRRRPLPSLRCSSLGVDGTAAAAAAAADVVVRQLPLQLLQLQQLAVEDSPLESLIEWKAVAAVTLVVAAAVGLVLTRPKDTSRPDRETCGECQGSGICPACQGEGFVNRNLSPDQARRAKANAPNAAKRNTAALARKWNYCVTCNGARSCSACEGRGWKPVTVGGVVAPPSADEVQSS